jgi:hypothetical protein
MAQGYFETVEPKENSIINFAWDVLFHIGVRINEETMLRGWMFTLCARGIRPTALHCFDESTADTFAIAMSIFLQSTFFEMMHYHSPGSTSISLINLFIGGAAASFNNPSITQEVPAFLRVSTSNWQDSCVILREHRFFSESSWQVVSNFVRQQKIMTIFLQNNA